MMALTHAGHAPSESSAARYADGVQLTLLPNNRLAASLVIYLTLPAGAWPRDHLELIPGLILQGVGLTADPRDLHNRLDMLYGAVLECEAHAAGPVHALRVELKVAQSPVIPGASMLMEQAVRLLFQLVFGLGQLPIGEAALDEAAALLRGKRAARQEDRRIYAAERCAACLHPGAHTVADPAPVAAAALIESYRRALATARLDILIAGPLKADEVRRMCFAALADWQVAGRPAPVIEQTASALGGAPSVVSEAYPGGQQHLLLGFDSAAPLGAPGYLAAQLATLILGGNAPSWLYQSLRLRHGLAYATYAWLDPWTGAGYAYAAVDPADAPSAAEQMGGLFERLRQGQISQGELDVARDTFVRHLKQTAASNLSTIHLLWQNLLFGRPASIAAEIEQCAAISLAEVSAAAAAFQRRIMYSLSPSR